MTAQAPETVLCGNEDHDDPTPAVARISWPDGPYRPTTACLEDLLAQVEDSYTEGNPVRVEPITEPITEASDEVAQLRARLARAEHVMRRAINEVEHDEVVHLLHRYLSDPAVAGSPS